MRIKTKKPAGTSLTTPLLTEIGVASAEPRDGGWWDHGNSGGRVWSNYWHPDWNHGASVSGHTSVDSGCVSPNQWAHAQTRSKWLPWSIDGSYYRFC
ncbi:lactococcin 972 family bacteriocin [Corynebacterium mustelae]|uniref:lactococcin 972 family bacteriocin n=1 Tax=Corynebacterium mustelae TaxID=571915 RepID=UPI000A04289E